MTFASNVQPKRVVRERTAVPTFWTCNCGPKPWSHLNCGTCGARRDAIPAEKRAA